MRPLDGERSVGEEEQGAGEGKAEVVAYWVNFHVGTFASVSTILRIWGSRRQEALLCRQLLRKWWWEGGRRRGCQARRGEVEVGGR
jgi:hypothetical protein